MSCVDCMGVLAQVLPIRLEPINLRFSCDDVRSIIQALNKLQSKMKDVQGMIDERQKEGERPTPDVDAWLESAKNCEKEAARIRQAICCVQCILINASSRLVKDMDDLHSQAEGFQAVTYKPNSGAIQEIGKWSWTFELESYLKEVNRYLADDEEHIVGIWGMAGVGKTTLLQTINNELLPGRKLSQRNTFAHALFVEASRDYAPEQLQESIAKQLGLDLNDAHDVRARAPLIKAFLRTRNFLLLLDDLWKPVDLEEIGIPIHSHSGSQKCKVIYTTQSKQVRHEMHKMHAHKEIKMECLDARNARRLFERYIDQVVVRKPALRTLTTNVIEKCGGLPIALTTIAQAMALKTDRDGWDIANALGQQSRLDEILDEGDRKTFEENLYKKLKISYNRLSDDTAKDCFLSCALWPKGCTIEKDELIQSWMGLGFFDRSMNHDFNKAYAEGNEVIESLEAACLLEADLTCKNKDDLTSKNKVKMHGVIRDMALWISNEEGADMNKWIVKDDTGFLTVLDDLKSWEAAQRISLMSHRLTELPPTLDCPRLSSLMLQKNPGLTEIPRDFFQLKVALSFLDLSFTGLCKLPEEIGSLLQLHYLNLSNTPISSLPDNLKLLKGLKYLLLNNTRNLTMIQYGLISSLSKLLVLNLFGCGFVDWELDDCCNRASLKEFNKLEQGLKFLGITIETSEALDQLSRIPRLSTQHLGIVGWVPATSLQQLMDLLCRPRIYQNLKQLKVENCGSSQVLTIGDDNGSWHLPRLQVLELHNVIRLTQIVWTAVKPKEFLPMIRELKISHCDTLEDVSWVLDLQHLERLELSNCKCMKKVVKNDSGKQIICDDRGIEVGDEEVMQGPFCGLRTLILKELSALRGICDYAYDFLALEYLEVQDCPMLRQLPFNSEIIKNKSLVIHGEDKWWYNIELKGKAGKIKQELRFRKFCKQLN